MAEMETREGGCLCGRIRYRTAGEPFAAEYCHCRMCQKSVGAVVVNWMDFRAEQVTWLSGEPDFYASSAEVRRGFCASCGTALMFRDTRYPEYATLTIASLDDPDTVVPTRHIYTESQCRWLNIVDDGERFKQGLH
ncbi:MAG: GFA family protein [Pseudomonadota bacterium]